MRNKLSALVLALPILLSGCFGESEQEIAQRELKEQKEREAIVQREREKAEMLWQQGGSFASPEDQLRTTRYGKYKWGEVYEINTESAKALITMAFESRTLISKTAINQAKDEKTKRAFEIIYTRTRDSLKVHQCDEHDNRIQAVCIISLDNWNKKLGTFENKKTIQAFARGTEKGSWRPISINRSKSNLNPNK